MLEEQRTGQGIEVEVGLGDRTKSGISGNKTAKLVKKVGLNP